MKLTRLVPSRPVIARFVAVRYLAAATSLTGCVPSTAYEQAVSTADVEREGHRRSAERLARAEGELAETRAERDRLIREKNEIVARLAGEESRLAQASLDIENGQKQSEQQQELVTQLRGELARVGAHIKAYEGQKSDLQSELEEKAGALEAQERHVAALEAEVAGLKSNAQQSAVAQDQLEGALDELTELQNEVQKDKAPAPEVAVEDSPTEAGSADDDSSAAEVLPAEEAGKDADEADQVTE